MTTTKPMASLSAAAPQRTFGVFYSHSPDNTLFSVEFRMSSSAWSSTLCAAVKDAMQESDIGLPPDRFKVEESSSSEAAAAAASSLTIKVLDIPMLHASAMMAIAGDAVKISAKESKSLRGNDGSGAGADVDIKMDFSDLREFLQSMITNNKSGEDAKLVSMAAKAARNLKQSLFLL